MHKAERPSNYFSNSFTHTQAEQIQKGVICVQVLLEIHQTKHSTYIVLGPKSVATLENTFALPQIVEFGTYVDLTACTPPDINKPGAILRNPSGAPEG